DIYRGQLVPLTEDIKDVKSFFQKLLDFAFFVCFFPQLVAGPIVRAAHFLPQIRKRPQLQKAALSQALFLIMGGLFKKAVISDYISVNYVDRVFENPALYTGFENLMAVYGYAIQIYCDFSGYSDMAIGLALLMGFHLPENFRRPYQAQSIQDFWRRWHISLSTWLRDYLYISLGGNRKGKIRTYLNLMITMLLGGLWHGASWVYVIWGGLHGIALAIDRRLKEIGKIFNNPALRSWAILAIVHFTVFPVLYYRYSLGILEQEQYLSYFLGNTFTFALWTGLLLLAYAGDLLSGRWKTYFFSKGLSVIFVFQFISFCWVFFRAGAIGAVLPPVEATFQILAQIMGSFKVDMVVEIIQGYAVVFSLILLGFVLHYLPKSLSNWVETQFTNSPIFIKSFSLAFVIWLVIQTASADVVPFIYFQF
ncbi:MAG: MBOAT family O-acyltransferase, partial [Bacteroidota bacterium]